MTPRGGPLSENGKLIAICLLFPIFWPSLPAILICMGAEKIRDAFWGWRYRRQERKRALIAEKSSIERE